MKKKLKDVIDEHINRDRAVFAIKAVDVEGEGVLPKGMHLRVVDTKNLDKVTVLGDKSVLVMQKVQQCQKVQVNEGSIVQIEKCQEFKDVEITGSRIALQLQEVKKLKLVKCKGLIYDIQDLKEVEFEDCILDIAKIQKIEKLKMKNCIIRWIGDDVQVQKLEKIENTEWYFNDAEIQEIKGEITGSRLKWFDIKVKKWEGEIKDSTVYFKKVELKDFEKASIKGCEWTILDCEFKKGWGKSWENSIIFSQENDIEMQEPLSEIKNCKVESIDDKKIQSSQDVFKSVSNSQIIINRAEKIQTSQDIFKEVSNSRMMFQDMSLDKYQKAIIKQANGSRIYFYNIEKLENGENLIKEVSDSKIVFDRVQNIQIKEEGFANVSNSEIVLSKIQEIQAQKKFMDNVSASTITLKEIENMQAQKEAFSSISASVATLEKIQEIQAQKKFMGNVSASTITLKEIENMQTQEEGIGSISQSRFLMEKVKVEAQKDFIGSCNTSDLTVLESKIEAQKKILGSSSKSDFIFKHSELEAKSSFEVQQSKLFMLNTQVKAKSFSLDGMQSEILHSDFKLQEAISINGSALKSVEVSYDGVKSCEVSASDVDYIMSELKSLESLSVNESQFSYRGKELSGDSLDVSASLFVVPTSSIKENIVTDSLMLSSLTGDKIEATGSYLTSLEMGEGSLTECFVIKGNIESLETCERASIINLAGNNGGEIKHSYINFFRLSEVEAINFCNILDGVGSANNIINTVANKLELNELSMLEKSIISVLSVSGEETQIKTSIINNLTARQTMADMMIANETGVSNIGSNYKNVLIMKAQTLPERLQSSIVVSGVVRDALANKSILLDTAVTRSRVSSSQLIASDFINRSEFIKSFLIASSHITAENILSRSVIHGSDGISNLARVINSVGLSNLPEVPVVRGYVNIIGNKIATFRNLETYAKSGIIAHYSYVYPYESCLCCGFGPV